MIYFLLCIFLYYLNVSRKYTFKNNKTIILKGFGDLLLVRVLRVIGFGEQGREGVASRKNISKGM